MKTRVISGLIMVPLLILVYLGGYFILAASILVGMLGVKEFYNGFENVGIKPCHFIGRLAAITLAVISCFVPVRNDIIMLWLSVFIILSLIYMFKIEEREMADSMATILGIVYVVFFAYHVFLVDITMHKIVWIIFITAFGSDIFAYFTGYFFGKHKLAPVLSPKKTIEGAVGGVVGSALCSTIFGLLVMPDMLIHCVILGIICSPISMAGDLTASAFKRKMGIKDYGNLIPGQGGIMDRFDSVLFVAPAVFYYVHFYVHFIM